MNLSITTLINPQIRTSTPPNPHTHTHVHTYIRTLWLFGERSCGDIQQQFDLALRANDGHVGPSALLCVLHELCVWIYSYMYYIYIYMYIYVYMFIGIYIYKYIYIHMYMITPQHTATHCSTLQHTATHCSTILDDLLDRIPRRIRDDVAGRISQTLVLWSFYMVNWEANWRLQISTCTSTISTVERLLYLHWVAAKCVHEYVYEMYDEMQATSSLSRCKICIWIGIWDIWWHTSNIFTESLQDLYMETYMKCMMKYK